MEPSAIFFTLAVAVLVGMYLYQPFISRRRRREAGTEHQLSAMMAEYDHVLDALQELDFDNSLGKIPEDDYTNQRVMLFERGADLLRQLDEITPQSGSRSGSTKGRVEAAVASRRADAAEDSSGIAYSDDDLEAMISSRRKSRNGKSAGFCPRCGKAIMASDRFCPSCGKAVNN
jgi:rubrerythrin